MRQRIGRRLISIMLSVLMLVSLLPTAVFAEELQNQATAGVTEQVGEGTGNTVEDSNENEDSTGGEETKGESGTTYVAKVGDNEYATLEAAIAAAEPVDGVITYEIYGKAEVTSTDSWIQVLKAGLSNVTKVVFVGMTTDAEIIITNSTSVLADQKYDIDVSFENLTLSHPNGEWVNDLGHTTNYFACLLRNIGAAENTVTYTNCTFPNGVCDNQYGKTVFDSCKFTNDAAGKYNLWNYGGNTEIRNSTFTGTRGIKAYNEGTLPVAPTVKVENTTFDGLTEKAAIVASKPVDIAVANVGVTGEKGFITRDITGNDEVQLNVSGSQISGNFNITSEATAEAAKDEFNITGGTFNGAVSKDYLAAGTELKQNENGTYGVEAAKFIDLDTFIKWLENSNYSVDGASYSANANAVVGGKLVVKWSPVSGCYDTREGHTCTVNNVAATGNTPKRVNNGLTQFQLFEGENVAVTVKNVQFIYEPAAFTVCENSGWKGSFTAADAPAGQLYFMTTGDVTFDSCEFNKVVLTSFNTTGSSTVTNCKFANVYNNYAIKDIRGENVSVTGTTITDCGGGIMVSSTGDVEKVTISGNTFKDVDVAGTAAGNKVGTRGMIQVASSGTYTNTNYDFSNNTAANCGPVLRQLNESVKLDKANTENLKQLGNTLYTSDSKQAATVDGVVYPTLELAFAALNKNNYKTLEITDGAWTKDVVYWAAGEQSGYAAKLTDALTAAYKANAGDITIVCRPGADVGTMTHGHVADNITIYGNNAYLSGGECDLEVDTFKFSRETGAQADDGKYLTKDITINAYELDNLGVWGERHTTYEVNVNLTDCDGKAIAGKENVQRVYISGTTGVNNITLTDCDFLTAKTAVYSNANGAIVVDGCSFTGTAIPVNINHKAAGAVTVEVKGSKFTNCGDEGSWASFAAPVRFVNSGSGTMDTTVDSCTFTGTVGNNGDILIGDGRTGQKSNNLGLTVKNTKGWVLAQKPGYYEANSSVPVDFNKCVEKPVDASEELTISIKGAFLPDNAGSPETPYTLEQFSEMTRAEYIVAQERLGGTMYVEVGSYSYTTNGVLGNGVRDDTPGQVPDHSKLNSYAENGYLGDKNDGANGKKIVFVNGSITSNVRGYTSIDNIGTSLLLAVPAYTNVTFEGITFNNVMSFDYQLYTSPWSQLGSLNFEDCTFNGIIVGAIAAQSLKFDGCTFKNYTNTIEANSSNPTWIRPAYGNWTKGDNEGQGNDFRSLTEITFTNNTVTSTRPVKFERIAQWEMDTTVTATGNTFTINPKRTDGDNTKNVGMYFGANAKFDLVVDNNTAKGKTAGLYTAVYSAPNGKSYAGLPAGSTVKDASGINIEEGVPALEWKSTKPLTLKTTEEVAQLTTTKGVVKFATLQEAIAEAKDGDTVKLLKSCSGNGIQIKTENFATKGLTVDFGGCTYTVGGVLVGSPGTGSNAFQLLEGGKVTFQNGTIAGVTEGTKPAEDTPNWHGAPAIVIQNYCDLTLKDMTVSGGDETVYTVSNNHGDVVIEDSTINAGKAKGYGYGPFAFDVCGYSTYDGVSVTVKGSSTINGDIEVSRSANNTKDVKLALESGTINGKLKIDSSINSTATTVTKGSDVTVAAPAGYAWNTDGTLVAAVAQIGDVGYITLEAAIAAAASGDTVKLLADATEDVVINKDITLDLGGKTLTNTNAGKATISVTGGKVTVKGGSVIGGASYYNIEVTKGSNADLTLENVTATTENTGSSMIDNWGTLTINSGTYTGGMNVVKSEEGSKLTINGGTFTGTYAKGWSYNGVILSAGTTKITGGEFIQNATTPAKSYPSVVLAMKVDGYPSTIEITGGKFINNKSDGKIFYGHGKATSDNFEVSGGTFNKSISDGFCAEGFIPTKNADGTYGVKVGKYVAKVGSKNYETLADAIQLAANGKTITLLANVTENVTISAAKKLTLDLNGFTLNGGTGTAKAALTNYGTITIKDTSAAKTGTIKRDDNGTVGETSYYVIRNQGTMTIESGTVSNNSGYRKTNPTGSMIGSSLICNGDCDEGGALTIKGGTFTQNNFIAIKNGALGVLHVSGGTISSDHSAIQNWFKADITGGEIKGQLWTDAWKEGGSVGETKIGGDAKFTGEIVMDITGSSVVPALEINGGNLNVTNWRITSAAASVGAKPAISGGTFDAPVKPEYCASNYEPAANGDGTYGVKHFNVAKIGNTEYETLQEAFNEVTVEGTIELLHNVTVTETLTFNKEDSEGPTFLKMNGYTITGDGCRALQIVNGHLQIEGNGTPEEGKNVITSTGIGIASSVIRVGANGGKQNLSIANGVTVKTDCSYGITVFGGGIETLGVENSKVISTAKHNADYDGCAIATLGTDMTSANVTIKNGAYIEAKDSNAIYMPSGSLLIYGYPTITGLTGIYIKSGRATIKGANVYGTGDVREYDYNGNGGVPTGDALVIDSCGYPNDTPTVSFGDGDAPNFESTNAKPIGSYARDGYTKVTGFVDKGTFNKAIDKDLLKDGYVCVYNGENNYGVATTENCVAKVGDIYYATLQDAIDAANSGDTVVLVKDVDLTQTVVVNKTITLDMGGKKLFNTADLWDNPNKEAANWSLISVREGGDLTITGNGTFAAKKNDCYALDVQDGAKLVIKDGTFVGNIHAVYVFEGTATIDGGTYSVQQKFSAEKPDEFVLNCYDANRANGTAKIIVNGGTFVNFDPMNNQAEGVGTSFVAAGVGVDHVDGKFTAKSGMTAQVVDADGKSVKAFDKLSDALTDATAEQTVKLLNSVNDVKYVEVEANVTLDLNGYNITDVKLLWVTGTIIDSAANKGVVSATKYLLPADNGYAPIYNSTEDGYSFFDLNVFSDKTESGSGVWFRLGKSTERAAAVELMKANAEGRRIKAIVTVSWENGEEGSGKQSFEFADGKMATYLTDITQYAFEVTIGGLNRISGKITAQAQFVVYDAEGGAIYTIAGKNWTIQE